MVLPPLTMEDQTDEDFFDKLVDDDDEVVNGGVGGGGGGVVGGGEPSVSSYLGSNDEQVFANLSIDDVGTAALDGLDTVDRVDGENVGVLSGGDDVKVVEDFVAEDGGGSIAVTPEAVDREGSGCGVEGKGESDLGISGDGANSPAVKEVQWSAFSGGIREFSYSDFFDQIGDNAAPDPFEEVAAAGGMVASDGLNGVKSNQATCSSSFSFVPNGEAVQQVSPTVCNTEMQDQSSSQYWENLYPGWRYDPNTGQWVPVDGSVATMNNMENMNADAQSTDVYYLQHTAQSVHGSMTKESTAGTLSYWNQAAYGNSEYPAHMVFDAQYPGWYYDTIAQEWRSLESYNALLNQSANLDPNQHVTYESASNVNYYPDQNMTYGQGDQVNNYSYQFDQNVNWRDSGNDALVMPQPDQSNASSLGPGFGENGFANFASAQNPLQPNNHRKEYDQQFSATGFNGPNVMNFAQQPLQNTRLPYASNEGWSADGRPPHALVSFGFGGKLIVMKNKSSLHTQPAYAQDSAGVVISVLNVMEVAMPNNEGSNVGFSDCEYVRSLCQQSFSGPLVSGNVGSKELNKWIDERISSCNATNADYSKGEVQKMLLSLLKIACQYYGRLRSSFGADQGLKENDCPESALAKLFSYAKSNVAQFSGSSHCLQNMPSEGQIQASAEEVQMLLVSGRRMEALQCAQKGHLWGPALVIASLLGEQIYGETVKQMALHQLVAGSPLRTLCLLIAGQPAEVFSNSFSNNPQNGVIATQPSLVGPGSMLDKWEENLAVISANRTKGDELVITHLGDCLWRERGEVMAAHICYLVAEANIESYSESARLCLVGADHLKYPRTFASPQAIQRTELYEYAKVLGNSQFVLLPFQPYKLLYASMLAEVGKLSDSLKYCQAVLKSLKTGRSPEVDACRQMISSLEERIKIHQQGGYETNFARAKLVGKLLNFFDNTAHRVVGGLPPPAPSALHSNGQHSEYDHQSMGPRVSTSQSTMVMSSLMSSASPDSSNRKSVHNRSMSEPDFGRTPRKDESPKSSSSSPRDQTSVSGSSSRFGRFGSQIFQKTVGLVLRSRSDKQAKLGEENKFYYDEKLKRWVEEGAELQAEEMPLAPPPTATAFMNGMPDHDKKDESVNATIQANGKPEYNMPTMSNGNNAELPPIPSMSNHFSARGRMGVRSRYVDTFNKGGGNPSNSFQSPPPSIPAVKPTAGNPKFFIPTPVAGGQETDNTQSIQQTVVTNDDATTSNSHDSFPSPPMRTQLSTMPRHPSMDKGMGSMSNGNGHVPPDSRRTLSWGGGLDYANRTSMGDMRPLADVSDFPQHS